MGLPIKASFPRQKPFSSEEFYPGIFNVYFGQKRNFKTQVVENCICFQVLLEVICLDEKGKEMFDDHENPLVRSAFIGKMTPSVDDRSNLYKIHRTLFKKPLTKKLWEEDYQEGDVLIALVNGQPAKVMFAEPEYKDPQDPEKYYQNVDKIVGFVPNPDPDIKNNPSARDIENNEVDDEEYPF